MNESSTSNQRFPADSEVENLTVPETKPSSSKNWSYFWEGLVRMGLGEVSLRVGTGLASIALILMVVWVMGSFYLKGDVSSFETAAMAAPLPTATPKVDAPLFAPPDSSASVSGVTRLAQLHTILPSRPRFEMTTYEVQKGDTIFAIAEKFGLNPSSILWGNLEILGDNPHLLSPGQVLNILPSDGVLYEWHAGDGLNGVAKYFGVTPETIINWPSNSLTVESVGDFAAPNIAVGTELFVPGGKREFVSWSAPRITRDNPAVAKMYGPGSCGAIMDGAVGDGVFGFPTPSKWLSGYDYSPETNHFGIDLGGTTGTAIYAVDDGVVVYSGWNDWGYGYVIVIDHGNGWQSVYAHLSTIYAGCGQSVGQGETIGLMGSTGNSSGPHLHLELRSDTYGKANPWNFLP